jgi:hypothetical protein
MLNDARRSWSRKALCPEGIELASVTLFVKNAMEQRYASSRWNPNIGGDIGTAHSKVAAGSAGGNDDDCDDDDENDVVNVQVDVYD